METIRTLRLTNGSEIREHHILRAGDGGVLLHDTTDINMDSLVELADDSDISVLDAVGDSAGTWEIVDDTAEKPAGAS